MRKYRNIKFNLQPRRILKYSEEYLQYRQRRGANSIKSSLCDTDADGFEDSIVKDWRSPATKKIQICASDSSSGAPGSVNPVSATPDLSGGADSLTASPEAPGVVDSFTALPDVPGAVDSLVAELPLSAPGTTESLSAVPDVPGIVTGLTAEPEVTELTELTTLLGDPARNVGASFATNSAGDRIITADLGAYNTPGFAYVYEMQQAGWVQLGSDIVGTEAAQQTGWSVDMSSDGSRIVVGSMLDRVSAYEWDGSDWALMGSIIVDEDEDFGHIVRMSRDGNVIGIASKYDDSPSGANCGSLRIYAWSGSAWTQKGSTFYGDSNNHYHPHDFDLDQTGDTVVLSNFGEINDDGFAKVFSWDGSDWQQLGQTLQISGEQFGVKSSINAAGTRIAVAANEWDTVISNTGPFAGRGYIYELNGSTWQQMGSALEGEYGEQFGMSGVDLNDAGDRVVFSSRHFLNSTQTALLGRAAAYEWDGSDWTILHDSDAMTGVEGVARRYGGQDDHDLGSRGVAISGSGSHVIVSDYALKDANNDVIGALYSYELPS